MIIISFLSGLFKNVIFFTSIIFIHELGHFLTAKFFKWNIDKIYFYPYGGYTKFQDDLNKPLYQELIIMLMGPIFQIVYFIITIKFLSFHEAILFKNYHYSILFFNLLPIYPLDGGKLFNIVFNYFISFRGSFRLTMLFSFFFLMIAVICLFVKRMSISLSLFLVILLVICKLTSEIKKERFYFNKFLLERHLNHYVFNKIKVIRDLSQMSRDYKHVIHKDGKTYSEKESLSKYFSNR